LAVADDTRLARISSARRLRSWPGTGGRIVRALAHEEAKAFYDKFGNKQDRQAFYEEAALRAMVAHAALDQAHFVVEFGCGTGRLALELMQLLPDHARYLGTDLSATMVAIAAKRLAPYKARASAMLTNGSPTLPVEDCSVDRLISTYVFDLLADVERGLFLADAARALRPGGLLCLAGITDGTTPVSRAVMSGWRWLFALNPRWVGGCRPTRAREYLQPECWQVEHHGIVVSWGIASEVVVAARLPKSTPNAALEKVR
jgi:ubiquinone/menaquinone biosynthesis C-methylase UbiE